MRIYQRTREERQRIYDKHATDTLQQNGGAHGVWARMESDGERRRSERAAETIAEVNPETILELGGMCGYVTRFLGGASPHAKMTVVEFAKPFLEVLRVVLTEAVEIVEADILTADFGGRQWDVVVCMNLLEHVEDPQEVVARACRWSKQYALFELPLQKSEPDGTQHMYVFDRRDGMLLLAPHLHILREDFIPAVGSQETGYTGYLQLFGEVKRP